MRTQGLEQPQLDRQQEPATADKPWVSWIEVLFKEARRRRRRRWAAAICALLLLATATVAVVLGNQGGGTPHASPERPNGISRLTPPAIAGSSAPALFVSGDGSGGIGVYSTSTGDLVRHLALQTSGGPDQDASIANDGTTVYFSKPEGPCNGTIERTSTSGTSQPLTVVSTPGVTALDPTPNPGSNDLAWVGAVCGEGGTTFRVYLTNETTGSSTDLGPYFGRGSYLGLGWNSDGTVLAVEAAPTISILHPESSTAGRINLSVTKGCYLTNPAPVAEPNRIAVIRECDTSSGMQTSSDILTYNTTTGRSVARVISAPSGTRFQSLSIDPSGHALVGLASTSGQATTAQIVHGHLVAVGGSVPTGAQW
jgi:hypothetical protein